MREIKFRGKPLEDYGDINWFLGSLISSKDDKLAYIEADYQGTVPVEWDSVGQYTGLKDKNGKEIYEGDILTFEDAHYSISENGQEFGVFRNAGVIAWDCDYAQFYVTNRQSVDLESFFEYIGEAEVIGNIYENPEFLKD